jgi:ATP-dependent DNA ligase
MTPNANGSSMSITSSAWARQLFEAVKQIGAEGVVSKRLGSYRGGENP